jgi:hypothetical protein
MMQRRRRSQGQTPQPWAAGHWRSGITDLRPPGLVMLAWDPEAMPTNWEATRKRYFALNWIRAAATWTAFAVFPPRWWRCSSTAPPASRWAWTSTRLASASVP